MISIFPSSTAFTSNSEIFKEKAEENSEITGLLKESHYIWQLPLYIDGTSVQVDISRSADLANGIPARFTSMRMNM